MGKAPVGIKILGHVFNFDYYEKRRRANQFAVLLLTFLSYAALHGARKVLPVVKNKLKGTNGTFPNGTRDGFEPFNTESGQYYFSLLDISWAFSYSIGMLAMGHAAENFGRKFFLSLSLLGTGLLLCLFGLTFYLNIHTFSYFVIIQVFNGIIQSAAWPSIVPIVSGWVSKTTYLFIINRMGTVLGFWGNHYAVGNIFGQMIAAYYVENEWGMSFVANGMVCFTVFILVSLFLASKPESMGFDEFHNATEPKEVRRENNNDEVFNDNLNEPISFMKAICIPGVLEYSFSLFFTKVVVYTFLFWLPFYLNVTGIKGRDLTPSSSGLLAVLFDIGGIIGNIASGYLVDLTNKGGFICFTLQLFSSVFIFLFAIYGSESHVHSVSLLVLVGFFVNAPNTIITGAISANLGMHSSLKGNKRATSTISAIIDGIGCLGAAVAPIVVSQISIYGWNYVMHSLIVSCILSGILLTRVVIGETFQHRSSMR